MPNTSERTSAGNAERFVTTVLCVGATLSVLAIWLWFVVARSGGSSTIAEITPPGSC